jgi:hypothetical protein
VDSTSVVSKSDDELVSVGAKQGDESVTVNESGGGDGQTTGGGSHGDSGGGSGESGGGSGDSGGGSGADDVPSGNGAEDTPAVNDGDGVPSGDGEGGLVDDAPGPAGIDPATGLPRTDAIPYPPVGSAERVEILRTDPGSLLSDAQRADVDNYLQKSVDAEPAISKDIAEIRDNAGATERGWGDRLKENDSLYRKVVGVLDDPKTAPGLPLDDLLQGMKDTVRYTNASEPAVFTSSTRSQIQTMFDKGYENVTFKNTFDATSGYPGLNTTWRAPDGTLFEVQFHSPDSFVAKTQTHDLYGLERTLPVDDIAGRKALQDQQDEIFNNLERPPGAGDIKLEDFDRHLDIDPKDLK